MTPMTITVRKDGTIEHLHDDKLSPLQNLGRARIKRASHVEPGDPDKGQDPMKWYVDLTPSGGEFEHGPFDSRQDALDFEIEWMNKNYYQKAAI